MKPKYVYHGSSGGSIKVFTPKEPKDFGKNPDNKHKGVYATKNKKWAMVLGILAGVKNGLTSIETKKNRTTGIIYKGKTRKKNFYVYTFKSDKFRNLPRGSHQYICLERIKPIKKEKFLVKDYLKWIRQATEKEKEGVRKLI